MVTFGTFWLAVVCAGCIIQACSGISEDESTVETKKQTKDSDAPTHSALNCGITNGDKANEILKELDYETAKELSIYYINEFRRLNLCKSRVSNEAANCKYNIRVDFKSSPNGSDATLKAGGRCSEGIYYGNMVINLHPSKYDGKNFSKVFVDSYIHELTHAIQEVNEDVYDFNKDYEDRFCEKEARWVAKKIIKNHLKELL